MNDEFDLEAQKQRQQDLLSDMEEAKTDDRELAEVLEEYDFDDRILNEFTSLSQQLQHLHLQYLALKQTTQIRLNPNG